MIRFLLDENVPRAIAHGLRIRGVKAVMTVDSGLMSVDDDIIAAYALEQGFVIFTHDDDFLRLAKAGTDHGGIVYCKQGSRTIGEIIRYLQLMSDYLEPDQMLGQVEYVETS